MTEHPERPPLQRVLTVLASAPFALAFLVIAWNTADQSALWIPYALLAALIEVMWLLEDRLWYSREEARLERKHRINAELDLVQVQREIRATTRRMRAAS